MPRTLVGPETERESVKEAYEKTVQNAEKAATNADAVSQDYEEFVTWLKEELEDLKKYSKISSDPTFEELNDALAHHEGIMLGIIGTHNVLLGELKKAEKLYTKKYAECSEITRKKYNTDEKASTKYLSQKSLDNATMIEFAAELDPLEHKRDMLQLKADALKDMKESWSSFNFNLNVLSKNVQVETLTSRYSKSELLDVDGKPVAF